MHAAQVISALGVIVVFVTQLVVHTSHSKKIEAVAQKVEAVGQQVEKNAPVLAAAVTAAASDVAKTQA